MTEYPTHEEIAAQIMKIVKANLNYPSTHSREDLEDIIADLKRYSRSIPSVEEYFEKNLL